MSKFFQTVYDNFVEDVHINSEIFEPMIQNVKELTTRDVERINNKLSKDNASLTFNSDSLQKVKVCFIANKPDSGLLRFTIPLLL